MKPFQLLKKQYSIQDLKEIEKQRNNIDNDSKKKDNQNDSTSSVLENLSPNYKVVSSDYHNLPNIPSIQIVNVQEAPHIHQETKKNEEQKKNNISKTINDFLISSDKQNNDSYLLSENSLVKEIKINFKSQAKISLCQKINSKKHLKK